MLLIDDIHFIGGKGQTEESFFHTFNELHNTNRQIVITSDCPPRSMPLLEERLRSRFEWGLIVDIQPPDFKTRVSILESKARQKGIVVSREVLEYLARQSLDNVRFLEGSLNRVIALCKLLQATPAVEIAHRAIEDLSNKEPDAEVVMHTTILEAVAESFNLDKEDLIGRRRDKDASLARRLAMYIIRQETHCSLAKIGQELGGREPITVSSACTKVAEAINNDTYLRRRISDIKQKLYSK